MPIGGMMRSLTTEVDDLAERGADDDADGEVDDVAAGGKVAEFLEHGYPFVERDAGLFQADPIDYAVFSESGTQGSVEDLRAIGRRL